ncbi:MULTISPECIES: DUF3325 domain-containing protein [unclassified Acidovorax]|uniref:DUF3325 domain-containing protein n=1 Tax=unclassified Acidovorax TaxID=2684926 RepID=UPI00288321F5|nr:MULTISPECIES: DUF3325 domain-containing protein [unclassified Acidovorax]
MTGQYLALALSSCLAAFAALGLAMDRHYEDSYGRGKEPSPGLRRALRLAGTAGLLLSLWACLKAAGTSQGWVFWFGVMTLSALAVVLVLSYAPRRAIGVMKAGAWLAVLFSGMAVFRQ